MGLQCRVVEHFFLIIPNTALRKRIEVNSSLAFEKLIQNEECTCIDVLTMSQQSAQLVSHCMRYHFMLG